MIMDVVTRVEQEDPTWGKWHVDGHKFEVWVDMSSLAIRVALVSSGEVVEDASCCIQKMMSNT